MCDTHLLPVAVIQPDVLFQPPPPVCRSSSRPSSPSSRSPACRCTRRRSPLTSGRPSSADSSALSSSSSSSPYPSNAGRSADEQMRAPGDRFIFYAVFFVSIL